MKTTFLALMSSIAIFLSGCGLFGPQGSLTPVEQQKLVKTLARTGTGAALVFSLEDRDERQKVALEVATLTSESRAMFVMLVEQNQVDLEVVECYVNDLLKKINAEIERALGEKDVLSVELLENALNVLLLNLLPEGVGESVGLEKWQFDLIVAFMDGVIEGAVEVAHGAAYV